MISNSKVGTAENETARIARVIFEHATQISSQKDIPALIHYNAELARKLVGADRCSLWLLDQHKGELWTKVADGTGEIRIPFQEGIVGNCVTRDETILVNDVASDPHFLGKIDQERGYHTQSIACVPLRAGNKVIGAIQLLNKPGGFSAEDAQLLLFMGVYTASAIEAEKHRQEAEAARLLHRELEIAADVQRRLLPCDLGFIHGLEYFGLCRPALEVGGDYYDFQVLPEGAFGLSLGDVSGKGFPAAILMASIQTLLRSLLSVNAREPAQVITQLNAAVHRICVPERYSTLFCGVINAERSKLTYVNAGHHAPMIVRHGDRRIDRPQEGDIPAGLLPDFVYHQHLVPLFAGDLIVCFSDGLYDVQNPKGELWEDLPVEQILHDNRREPVERITQALIRAVDDYADGAAQFDDITIIVARVTDLSR
jgi:sigma-B regulation protein RsbU (phosphoserine phosphatase)